LAMLTFRLLVIVCCRVWRQFEMKTNPPRTMVIYFLLFLRRRRRSSSSEEWAV
jgi:hypothetical protein